MLAGILLQPSESFEIDLGFAWNSSDASLGQFDFVVDSALLNPNQSYDFTHTHENSDLEISRVEVSLGLQYDINDSVFLGGHYRWIDVTDDAPYRGDLGGEINFYSLSLGWVF